MITCVAGFIPFGDFISSDGEAYTIHLDGGVVAISLTVAIAAIALATWMYLRAKQPVADRLATTFSGLHKAAYHRFYIDEAYQSSRTGSSSAAFRVRSPGSTVTWWTAS